MKAKKKIVVVISSAMLVACAGGGSGSGASPSTPNNNGGGNSGGTPNTPVSIQVPKPSSNPSAQDSTVLAPSAPVNAKFNDGVRFGNTAAELVNLKPARDAGLTGAGVKIGVIDSVVRDTPYLTNVTRENFTATSHTAVTGGAALDDHGTDSALVIAGMPTSNFRGGIAPNATIVSAGVSSSANKIAESSVLNAWTTLSNQGVRLFNNSFGESGQAGIDAYVSAADLYLNASNATAKKNTVIGVLKQIIDNNGLMVFAAGNVNSPQPSNYALLPLAEPSLTNGLIAVGAVDANNVIASYSSNCGDAKNWCMVASGSNQVPSATATSLSAPMQTLTGTSFAAPQVTGTAALLLEKYPWMTNNNLRTTLLTTATDLGALGVDSVYGWGLLNVGKAINGPAQFAFGNFNATTDNGTYNFSNDISGTGGLIKNGGGNLILSGNNTYSGDTQINSGALTVTNHSTSNHNVASGATLIATDATIGSVNNNGTVTAKNSGMSINGNFIQSANARLNTDLGSRIAVTGTASLAGSLYFDGIRTGYTPTLGTTQTVLTANGVTGQFTLGSNPSLMLQGNLAYTSNAVNLILSRINTQNIVSTLRLNNTQGTVVAGANLVDASFDALDNKVVSTLSFNDQAAALQSVQNASVLSANLDSLSGSIYANSTDAMRHSYLSGAGTVLDNHQGLYAEYLHDNYRKYSGEIGTNGFTVGYAKSMGNDGFDVGAHYQTGQWQEPWGKNDADVYGLAASWKHSLPSNFYTKVYAGIGRYKGSVNRTLSIGTSLDHATVDTSNDFAHIGLSAGKDFAVNNRFSVRPELGLRLDWIKQHGFTEQSDSGFALSADSQSHTVPVALLGVQGRYLLGANNNWSLLFGAGFERDLSSADWSMLGRFNGTNNAAQSDLGDWGNTRSRWYSNVGLSTIYKGVQLSARYQFSGGTHVKSHQSSIQADWLF
jgi:autotransporter serine protease